MSGSIPGDWMERVSAALREQEERQTSILALPPRYETLGEIGRGGMGIVYRAWDPQLGRDVALKVLSAPDGKGAEAHERFQREAKLAAALSHPHIVQVFDSGTWNGQDYIAMQLVEGTSLDQARLAPRQALGCVRDAARALEYAHGRGIIHRDIKPGNLLVDQARRVYITDFGVARQGSVSATLTSPGTVVGTPAYMAPEQAQGLPADARSDVYSLGATLYELVVGRPPYGGKDAAQVLDLLRSREPDPPRRWVPHLSRNVEAIILGALERLPAERYQTAGELADDIDRYLGNERPHRRPRGLSYRVRRQFVRHPWRSTAALMFCALLLMAGIVLGSFIRGYLSLVRARETSDPAARKRYYKIAEPWFSEAAQALLAIDAQEALLARERIVREKESVLEEERREAALRLAAQRKADEERQRQLQIEADESKRLALIAQTVDAARNHLDAGHLEDAAKAIGSLVNIAPHRHAELLPRLVQAEFDQAAAHLGPIASKANEAEFVPLFDLLQGPRYEAVAGRSARLSRLAFDLARALRGIRSFARSIAWFDQAERLRFREDALYEERGLSLLEQGDWARAQKDFDSLLGLRPANAPIAPRFAELSYRKGKAALEESRFDDAIREFAVCLRIDPRHAHAHHDRGIARYRLRALSREALSEDLNLALTYAPTLRPGPEYREIALAFAAGEAERAWKEEKAELRLAAWKEALTWLSRILELSAPGDPDLLLARSRMRRRSGDLAGALKDAALGAERRRDGAAFKNLGILEWLQDSSAGRDAALLRKSLDHLEEASRLEPRDPELPYWKGLCRWSLGRAEWSRALVDFEEASAVGYSSRDLEVRTASLELELKPAERWSHAKALALRALAKDPALREEDLTGSLREREGIPVSKAEALFERDASLALAEASSQGQEFDQAIEAATRVIQLDPTNAAAYLCRGYSRYQRKLYQAAQQDFRSVLELQAGAEEKARAQQWLEACQKRRD